MKKNYYLLASLVLLAFLVRVLFIWLGRPEFVGWFNHTYYYYVQTGGLVENGALPFDDMPLLFYVYAWTAKLLMTIGMDMKSAVVNTSRFWMCLIPSLLPIPVFQILKKISPHQKLPSWAWVFLFAMAFYPLSILYMPEFLQKNALGLLLLAVLMNQSIELSRSFNLKNFGFFIGVFLLIILTHYGSTGVAVLYCTAFASSVIVQRDRALGVKIMAGVLLGLAIALYAFSFFDVQRFERVGFYMERVFDTSTIGVLLGSSSDVFEKIMSLLFILVPIGILWYLYKVFSKGSFQLSGFLKDFWLAIIVFAYLLVLPIYDQLLLGRFSLFLPLVLVFVLYLPLQYTPPSRRLRNFILAAIMLGTLVMMFGEYMSLNYHNRNKEAVYADIVRLKEEIALGGNDLIIGRNGVEHISNWFLGTKSCIITSFNQNDFERYDRVFMLNPTERGMRIQGRPNESIDWYNLMLGNVPEPENGKVVFSSTHLRLIELTAPPIEWNFDKNGNWVSFKNEYE
jgi:hypothetical protein